MLEGLLKSACVILYEAVCCMVFMNIFLKHKWERGSWSVLYLLSMTVGSLICVKSSSIVGNVSYIWRYTIRCFMIVGYIFILSFLFYQGTCLMKLFLSIMFYGILTSIDYLEILFVGKYIDSKLLETAAGEVLVVVLCKTVLFITILLLDFLWKRQQKMVLMKNSEWILMLAFPVLTVIVMLVLLFAYQGENSMAVYETAAGAMCLTNLILFFLLQYVSSQEQNKEKMQAYYEMSIIDENQKRLLHEYNNQLTCLTGLLQDRQYDKAETYLKQIFDTVQEGTKVVDVGNPILNVVLNQKYEIAEQKGIAILFYVNDLSDLWLEEQDIVIMLSNLLDNAIEACEKVQEERIIRLKLVREEKEMVVSVQNRVNEPVHIDQNGIIPTIKRDKRNHGIGLRNVQRVLDKYQGMGRKRYEDGWFYYTAIIPKM